MPTYARVCRGERLCRCEVGNAACVPHGPRGLPGIRPALVVDLETTGRKSGQPRRVPLAGRADDEGVWVISQYGHRAGWAHNIAANPKVRARVGNEWHTGTATFELAEDVRARARSFGGGGRLRQSATALTIRAMESDPISVRITFD